jgi:poly-gamma-glutamate biosynthesis protein PgsC/CapC
VTGLPPEISALVIAFGLVLALVCYLVTNLSPGGMITPGWLALAFIVQPLLALVIVLVVAITYVLCQALQQVVILYGKRLFATVVLIAVFLQMTVFLFFLKVLPFFYDATTLGFIVPGLIAYQLLRQPPFATITATATVTMVVYTVMLVGILLRFVPIEDNAAASDIAAAPSAPFGSLHLALSVVGAGLILVLVGVQTRRVRHAWAGGRIRLTRRAALPIGEKRGGLVPAPAGPAGESRPLVMADGDEQRGLVLAGACDSQGLSLALGWFPARDYQEWVELWDDLGELWTGISHAEYCQRLEATLRGWSGHGMRPKLVKLYLSEYLTWCEDKGADPAMSRDVYAATMLRLGAARAWPPDRDEACWCESGKGYGSCCGAVSVAALHPLDASAPLLSR